MKLKLNTKTNKGFTLIEMIGVLAVIAILAALLIPKVFNAINEARINTVPVGVGTIKAAAIEHYAKWGALNVIGVASTGSQTTPIATTDLPYHNWDDKVLLVEGFIEKTFAPKVGTTNDIMLVAAAAATATVNGSGKSYDLDGKSTDSTGAVTASAATGGLNDAAGSHVLEAKLVGVPIKDAQEISMRIDGLEMSQPTDATQADLLGRVTYGTPTAGSPVDVYIYITHR